MSTGLFRGQSTLLVHAWGQGKLHLLSYDPNVTQLTPHVGDKSTTNSVGPTDFVIGFSHYFRKYAFYWEGDGDAYLRIGTSPDLIPVGKSWATATSAPFGGDGVSTTDVSSLVGGAIVREEATTVFVLPSLQARKV